jgi:U3 small nucleolar RNA-associated protein 13
MEGHSDKVWALDVTPSGKTMISGGADSQICVWQDTTREAEDAKRAEREEAILMDQRLANHLRHKEFSQALEIALKLDKPRLCLKTLTLIIEADIKEKRSATASLQKYAQLWPMDRVAQILRYCREWNTRARNCDVAQLTVQALVSVFRADDLASAEGIPEILAGIAPYSERHFDRLDRVSTSSYLLDLALFSMGSLENEQELDFAAWESKSKLVLPSEYVDGKIQIGGQAVVGRRSAKRNDSDDDVSTVGDSDSDEDEEEKEPKFEDSDGAMGAEVDNSGERRGASESSRDDDSHTSDSSSSE